MASYNLSALAGAGAQFFDDNGNVLSGGKIYTYRAGTTTPATTYTNNLGSATNTNPIVLDAAGRTPQEIWLQNGQTYKFVIKTSTETLVGTYDNIPAINDTAATEGLLGNVTGTDSIAATASPTITSYVAGDSYAFIAVNTNTGAVTLAIDGLTAKSVTKNGSIALSAGEIQSGMLMYVKYDGTRFQLINPAIQSASTTYSGLVRLATTAEAQTGTNSTAAVTPAALRAANVMTGTVAASTSGSTVEFNAVIPSWAKRVTINLAGVSTNGTAAIVAQLGTSGGYVTSGYLGSAAGVINAASPTVVTATSGFQLGAGTTLLAAASVKHGSIVLTNITGNTWVASGVIGGSDTASIGSIAGSVALSGSLDRVRLFTSDTFDAGSVNIMWE